MAARPKDFAEYFARLDPEQRRALERLRKAIHAAAPGAVEYIGYGLPSFRYRGKRLLCMGARAGHCALYPMSATTVRDHRTLLTRFETSRGTIRFQPERPLPLAVIRTLVRARIRENEE